MNMCVVLYELFLNLRTLSSLLPKVKRLLLLLPTLLDVHETRTSGVGSCILHPVPISSHKSSRSTHETPSRQSMVK